MQKFRLIALKGTSARRRPQAILNLTIHANPAFFADLALASQQRLETIVRKPITAHLAPVFMTMLVIIQATKTGVEMHPQDAHAGREWTGPTLRRVCCSVESTITTS